MDWSTFCEHPLVSPEQNNFKFHQFLWASEPYEKIDAKKPYRTRIDELIADGLTANTEIVSPNSNGNLPLQIFVMSNHEHAVRYLLDLGWFEEMTLTNRLRCIMTTLFNAYFVETLTNITDQMLNGVDHTDIHDLVLSEAWRGHMLRFADSQNKIYRKCEALYDFLNSRNLLPPMDQRPPATATEEQEEDGGIEKPHYRLPMPRWWN